MQVSEGTSLVGPQSTTVQARRAAICRVRDEIMTVGITINSIVTNYAFITLHIPHSIEFHYDSRCIIV